MRPVVFTGERVRLVLGVGGYEFDTATDSHDKNWLTGSVALEAGAPPKQVVVSAFEVFWQTTELLDFELELRAAWQSRSRASAARRV